MSVAAARRLAMVPSDGLLDAYRYKLGMSPISRSGQHAPDRPACLPGMNSRAPCVPKCSRASAPKSSRRNQRRRRRRRASVRIPSRTTGASDHLRSRRRAARRRRRCRNARRAREWMQPSLCCLPGAGPHCASISLQVTLAAHMLIRRDALVHVGERAELTRIAVDDRLAQHIDTASAASTR